MPGCLVRSASTVDYPLARLKPCVRMLPRNILRTQRSPPRQTRSGVHSNKCERTICVMQQGACLRVCIVTGTSARGLPSASTLNTSVVLHCTCGPKYGPNPHTAL